jgi:hypothetical protein
MFLEVIVWILAGSTAVLAAMAIGGVVRLIWKHVTGQHRKPDADEWRNQYKGVDGVDEPFEVRFRNPHDPDDD